jgi:PAS domain S-box-containing protein
MTGLPKYEVEFGALASEPADGEVADYLAAIVDCSDDAILSKDLHGRITSWNKGAERLFGYASAEAVGKPITLLLPPDRRDEEPAILERISRGERVDHYETARQRKDGSLVEVSLTASPVRNAKGQIVGVSKIARDITGRKRKEAQLATLAREAEHRAKNVLSVVQACVQLSQADTPEELKRVIAGRVQALASVVSLFAETRWAGAELRTLVAEELSPYCLHGAALRRLDGPKLMLEPNAAQAIAITLHELATNAAKYGALLVSDGHVDVEWSRTEADQIALRWTETGGPSVAPPVREGFGTQLMNAMIRRQLEGEIGFDWRVEGLACEITFSHRGRPLRQRESPSAGYP